MKNDSDGEGAGVCLPGNAPLPTQGFALRVNDKRGYWCLICIRCVPAQTFPAIGIQNMSLGQEEKN